MVYAEQWIAQRRLEGLRLKTVAGYKTPTRRGAEPAPRTVRNARALLGAVFASAVAEGLIERSPVPRLHLVDVDADPFWRPSNLWEAPELALLSGERPEWHISAAIGIRASELAALQGRDLHLREACLAISRSWSTEGKCFEAVKSRVPRLVPIPSGLLKMLQERLRGAEDLLFPGPTGAPWRNDTLWKALQTDCRALSLRPRGHHTFRATLITRLTEAGITDPLIDAITHRSRRGRDALRGYQRPRMAALLEALERVQVKPESARQQSFDFGGRR